MNNTPRRIWNAYRLGKLAALVAVLIAGAAGISRIQRPPPSSGPAVSPATEATLRASLDLPTPVPTDTVTLNLTWEEWADLVQCIYATTTFITVTADSGPAYLDAATLEQADATHQRLNALADTLYLQAQTSVPEPPEHVTSLIFEHSDSFSDLWRTLYQAFLNSLTPPQ